MNVKKVMYFQKHGMFHFSWIIENSADESQQEQDLVLICRETRSK